MAELRYFLALYACFKMHQKATVMLYNALEGKTIMAEGTLPSPLVTRVNCKGGSGGVVQPIGRCGVVQPILAVVNCQNAFLYNNTANFNANFVYF